MRTRLTVIAAAALFLTACGGGDPSAEVDPSPTVTVTETVTEDPGGEGEPRDPDALFGVDVCRALLPALDGDTDGLERYATDEVLAELSDGAGDPVSDVADVYETDDGCAIGVGDVEFSFLLMGDGHVGHRAVEVNVGAYTDSGGGAEFDEEAVARAVAAARASGAVCDGSDDLPEGFDDHSAFGLRDGVVVAVACEVFAYQNIYELHGWDGDALVQLEVQQWRDGDLLDDPMILGFPYVENLRLVNLEKARGIGDCGTYQEWELDGDVLELAFATMRDCDDDAEYVEPHQWPQVHPVN